MYTEHFGLNKLPFENVPDPHFFYDQGNYSRIRKQISGSLQSGRGLIVVTGPIGSGKTTLSQMIKSDFSSNIRLIWMAEPPANSTDLYLFLAQELGLQPSSSEKTFIMRDVRKALIKINSEGKKCLVIMDESHLMTSDVINGVRLLNNLEEGPLKLIQLLLLGQEEFLKKINNPEMEPFKQRIATLEVLGRLDIDGIRKYVSHRIQVAGGETDLISNTGWEALTIAFNVGGTPRMINALCDRSFNVACEREKPVIDAQDVYEATQRIGLVTDVFHYIISLRDKDRKDQDLPLLADELGQEETVREKGSQLDQEQFGPAVTQKVTRKTDDRKNNVPGVTEMNEGVAATSFPEDQVDLKLPTGLLLVSIAAFVLSVLFFCQRVKSTGSDSCITNLLGF